MSKFHTIDIEALAKQAGFEIHTFETGNVIVAEESDGENSNWLDCSTQVRKLVQLALFEAANIAHVKGKELHSSNPKAGGYYSAEAAILRVANQIKG
jgi:hypothetical protein